MCFFVFRGAVLPADGINIGYSDCGFKFIFERFYMSLKINVIDYILVLQSMPIYSPFRANCVHAIAVG
jgi:hypothetical protein